MCVFKAVQCLQLGSWSCPTKLRAELVEHFGPYFYIGRGLYSYSGTLQPLITSEGPDFF